MLFNSYTFIFAFLPVVLVGYYLIRRSSLSSLWVPWLVLSSLFFYAWWNPVYLWLLGISIVFNFMLGGRLAKLAGTRLGKTLLLAGVAVNLGAIGYFKYLGFFADVANSVAGTSFVVGHVILPLAISFFTFQQITFLVDAYAGRTKEYDFWSYCLFVSFFPQLIAGPIVHHSEMMPQFRDVADRSTTLENMSVGLTIFAFGLFKKAVLADGIAPYANLAFGTADGGGSLDFFAAWGGALAYTFQLYFDFSGYSDMAIGIARMFNVRLPLNFNSPYKALSIVDFWRRWHMTLSRFLRDYVYIPLGGNRKGRIRRHGNLMATMLIGGLWHGAGWTFVVWGGLHGLYLVINHFWSRIAGDALSGFWGRISAWGLTFLAVVVGWVFFRATSFDGAIAMLQGMAGQSGVSLPAAIAYRVPDLVPVAENLGVVFTLGGGATFLENWIWVLALGVIAFFGPNTEELVRRYQPVLNNEALGKGGWLVWSPSARWAFGVAGLLGISLLALPQVSEFLYFQF